MPYITRERASDLITDEIPRRDYTQGDLNYLISCLLRNYIVAKGLSYTNISSAIAASNDAAEECRRRLLNPYEDLKRYDNKVNIDPYENIKEAALAAHHTSKST